MPDNDQPLPERQRTAQSKHPPAPGSKTGAKVFDASGKGLIDSDPLAFVRLAGLPGKSARIVNSDLTTSLAADRLILVAEPDYLLDFELLASRDLRAPATLWAYHAVGHSKYDLPVESVLCLLRREADSPTFTGEYISGAQRFVYHVLRIWEIDPEDLLSGPLALLPLAPIARVEKEDLPDLIRRMQERTGREVDSQTERFMWTGIQVLLGLRMDPATATWLLKGVFAMLDLRVSSTYQAILEEGKVEGKAEGLAEGKIEGKIEGERHLLVRLGTRRLGPPSASVLARLEAVASAEELDRLADRLFEVETWDDLLA